MAPANPAVVSSIIPSQPQVALAIAIVRTKPPHCSVRDYILQLREKLRPGKSPLHGAEGQRYLDLVAYWQAQYRSVQEECHQLRSVNIKLERSNHLLTNLANPTSDLAPGPQSLKRKGRSALPVKTSKRLKVLSTTTTDTQEVMEHDSDFLDTLGDCKPHPPTLKILELKHGGEGGARLTESLYTTHALCRASSMDAERLCRSLVQTSSMLGKVIHVVAQHYDQLSSQARQKSGATSLDRDKSDFSAALSICARAFMSILIGLGKLQDSDADLRLPSLVICELVGMFKTALNSIEASARQTAQLLSPQSALTNAGNSRGGHLQVKESAPAQAIAHLLIGCLGMLDKTESNHQKLFDGFTFMLFERAGKRLYYCTFGQTRSCAIEHNITSASSKQHLEGTARQEIEELAIRLEVKALVVILERAMGLAPNHMNPKVVRTAKSLSRAGRTLSMKSLPTSSRAQLSQLAKERLQRTLITCMYGSKSEDEFLDVLTKPLPAVRLEPSSKAFKVENVDFKEWYKQEVWRLVGWDILARESGW